MVVEGGALVRGLHRALVDSDLGDVGCFAGLLAFWYTFGTQMLAVQTCDDDHGESVTPHVV